MIDVERYPIGRHDPPERVSADLVTGWIESIAELPDRLAQAVDGLSDEQLATPYREGGWTVRQVVHHVADSHMNAYVRHRLAATEEEPLVKTYDEARWAELADSRSAPVDVSLSLLRALHTRWTLFLRGLPEAAFARPFRHPELGRVTLGGNLSLYAWHGRHHTAHVTSLRSRRGW